MSQSARPHALLAGGGTGGHVFPALAVGEELARRGFRVSFLGSPEGMEARLVPQRGLPFVALPSRPLLGKSPVAKARALWTVGRSTLAARRWIRAEAVDVVAGTGGYASAPAVLGARLAGRPSLLVEPNAVAGLANRWLSRFAAAAAVAYERTADQFQCPAHLTGVPVRESFFSLPEASRDGRLRLLVLGGSQGARQLNLAVPPALARLPREILIRLSVLHQAGAERVEEAREAYAEAGLFREGAAEVTVAPFLDDVAGAMGSSHLLVCRAGALTVAEIAAAGRAAVLVPLSLAGGHQMDNARVLADAGAARVIGSADLTAEDLAAALESFLGDRERLAVAGRAARAIARPGAAVDIADLLAELAGSPGAWAEPPAAAGGAA